MNIALRFIYRFATAVWLGTIVATSLMVAPIVFNSLPRQTAANVMTQVFSAYYGMGLGLGLVALVALGLLASRSGWSWERWAATGLLILMVTLAGYTRLVTVPELVQVRGEMWAAEATGSIEPALRERFDTLHHRSVTFNVGMLLAGTVLVLVEAVRTGRLEKKNAT